VSHGGRAWVCLTERFISYEVVSCCGIGRTPGVAADQERLRGVSRKMTLRARDPQRSLAFEVLGHEHDRADVVHHHLTALAIGHRPAGLGIDHREPDAGTLGIVIDGVVLKPPLTGPRAAQDHRAAIKCCALSIRKVIPQYAAGVLIEMCPARFTGPYHIVPQ
jgi:hypothetical protein